MAEKSIRHTDGQKNLSDTLMDRKIYKTHQWTEKSIRHTDGQKNLSDTLIDRKKIIRHTLMD